jgi:hypothetical protein
MSNGEEINKKLGIVFKKKKPFELIKFPIPEKKIMISKKTKR